MVAYFGNKNKFSHFSVITIINQKFGTKEHTEQSRTRLDWFYQNE